MSTVKIYLDTSVISAYFDERNLKRQEETKDFWKNLNEYECHISEIVIKELNAISDLDTRQEALKLIYGFNILTITRDVEELALNYISKGIFPRKYKDDAQHLASATANGIDIIVSWNFKHLVKRKTRIEANLANSLYGYKNIDIIAPPEL